MSTSEEEIGVLPELELRDPFRPDLGLRDRKRYVAALKRQFQAQERARIRAWVHENVGLTKYSGGAWPDLLDAFDAAFPVEAGEHEVKP